MGQCKTDHIVTNTMRALSLLLLAASALAQDTHFCNDGWDLYSTTWNGEEHHSCFYFGGTDEKVSFHIAELLCEAMGGFVAEVPYGPSLNHWIVDKLLEYDGNPGKDTRVPMGDQYWLGAKDHGWHDEHRPVVRLGQQRTKQLRGAELYDLHAVSGRVFPHVQGLQVERLGL